jgi:hypothetical protein
MAVRCSQILGRPYKKDCPLTRDYKTRKQVAFALEIEENGKSITENEQAAIHSAIEVLASQGCEFVRTKGLQSVIGANEILCRHGIC